MKTLLLTAMSLSIFSLVACGAKFVESKATETTHDSVFLRSLQERFETAAPIDMQTYDRYVNLRTFDCIRFYTTSSRSSEQIQVDQTFVFSKTGFDSMLRLKRFLKSDPTKMLANVGTISENGAVFDVTEGKASLAFRREASGSLIAELNTNIAEYGNSFSVTTSDLNLNSMLICVAR